MIFRNCLQLVAILLITLFLASCEKRQSNTDETTLYLNWVYAGSFAGEIVGAKKYSSTYGIDINIEEGGPGLDPLKLVGKNEFGIASSDEILRAIEKGRDIVIIGVVNENHPAAFVSLSTSGIEKPEDFVGKRVGVLPFGSTGLIYKSLLEKTGVKATEIEEVIVSPDLRPFISGDLNDVQPIFIFDETVTLEDQGLDYNLIVPSDFGVEYKGASYFTTKSTYEDNPKLVKSFLNSMNDGWNYSVQNPENAISMLTAVSPSSNEVREAKLLNKAAPYYINKEEPFLLSDAKSWDAWMSSLVENGVLTSKLDTESFLRLEIATEISK